MDQVVDDPAPAEPGFPDALVRLSHIVQYVFADVTRQVELTPQQGQLLCVLTSGPVGLSELSRTLHQERSSLTGLIDRVERRGLVERRRHPQDRRAYSVVLTKTGLRLAHEVHAEVSSRLDRLAADVPKAPRETVTTVARTLVGRYHGPATSSPEASSSTA